MESCEGVNINNTIPDAVSGFLDSGEPLEGGRATCEQYVEGYTAVGGCLYADEPPLQAAFVADHQLHGRLV